jgi:ABC-type multidrug transport system fused ATPase/permease subunit
VTTPPPSDPPVRPTGWQAATEDRVDRLTAYFVEHEGRYTLEALRAAASDAGFTSEEIDLAGQRLATRREIAQASRPIRARARWIVLGAYALVYAVLAWALLSAPNLGSYGMGEFALIVLSVVLGIGLVISIVWVNRRRLPARLEGALPGILALPLIMLVAVAGLCVVTTRPFGVV